MSKHQNKVCLYCGNNAETKDHVPSKSLLEKPFPNNLLTIPCCGNCNRSFSLDEEYFLNVLIEVSINPTLTSKKQSGGSVFKARERSVGLRKRIENSLIQADDGKIYFKSENDRIKRVIEKNAFGLFFHRFNKIRKLSDFNCSGFYPFSVEETRPSEIFLLTFTEKFQSKRWTTVQANVFSYIVVRDWRRNNKLSMILHLHNSAWCTVEIPFPNGSNRNMRLINEQLTIFN